MIKRPAATITCPDENRDEPDTKRKYQTGAAGEEILTCQRFSLYTPVKNTLKLVKNSADELITDIVFRVNFF